MGYDKDNDVYETLAVAENPQKAAIVARCIAYYDSHVEELRRTDNNEPFDWFCIKDEAGGPQIVFR